ncbi:MAG: hypothetical protein CMM74_03380 [Rhodospirillaceae bacterium]|nr:hypothetical protein [Rhodospirillaceae bacterium]
MITIDGNGVIEAYNPAAELIFGYSAEEAIRQSLNLIVPINQKDEHARYIKDSDLHAPKIIHRERELNGLHKSGKLIPIKLKVTPMSSDGETTYVGTIRDISDRIKSKNELNDQAERHPEDRLHQHFFAP